MAASVAFPGALVKGIVGQAGGPAAGPPGYSGQEDGRATSEDDDGEAEDHEAGEQDA